MTDRFDDWVNAPALTGNMKSLFNHHLNMIVSSQALLSQTPVDLKLVPTIGDRQALIQSHALQYQHHLTWQFDVNNVVLELAGAWGDYMAIHGLRNDDAVIDKELFGEAVSSFTSRVKDVRERLDNNLTEIIALGQVVKDDQVALAREWTDASDKVSGKNGEISALRVEIASFAGQLAKLNAKIEAGAEIAALKGIELGIKVGCALFEIPGVGSLIIDTSMDYANKAAKIDEDPLAESKVVLQKYAHALSQLEGDLLQMAALRCLETSGQRFCTAFGGFETAYKTTRQSIDDLIASLEGFDPNAFDGAFLEKIVVHSTDLWEQQAKDARKFIKAIEGSFQVGEEKTYV